MDQGTSMRSGALSTLVVAVVALALVVSTARPAEALWTAPAVAPVLFPATAGVTSTGVVISGWGTGGAAAATGVGAAGALPVVAAVAAVVVVGGLLYVGYRHFSGDPIEWWWQDGDPAEVELPGDPGGWAAPGQPVRFVDWFTSSGIYWAPQIRTHSNSPGREHASFGLVRNTSAGSTTVRTQCSVVMGGGAIAETVSHIQSTSVHTYNTWREGTSEQPNVNNVCPESAPFVVSFTYSDADVLYTWVFDRSGAGPATGFPGGVAATVTTKLECTPVAGGDPFIVTETSDPYLDPNSPEPIPDASCPVGSRITDVELLREAPGIEPLRIDDGPMVFPEIIPAPSYIDPADEALWDSCMTGICTLEVVELEPNTQTKRRTLAPPGDVGWHLRPDRDLLYQCRWYDASGSYLVLPLQECQALQWQIIDIPETGEQTTVNTPVTPETPTLEPPVSETSAPGCMDGVTESGFLGSKIIARGVKCALVWAFIPDPLLMEQTVTQPLRETLDTKLPFSLVQLSVSPILSAFQGAQSCDVNVWRFPPERPDLPEDFYLGIPCTPPFDWLWPYQVMNVAVILGTAWGLWNLAAVAANGPKVTARSDD